MSKGKKQPQPKEPKPDKEPPKDKADMLFELERTF